MKYRCILFLFTLPLLFTGISGVHDWGDDFAQYLIQAKNIVEHKSQTENGLTFNQGQLPYALKAYPVGFPILLSPLYLIFGLRIMPYLVVMTLLLMLSAMRIFSFAKKYFDERIALSIALWFAYSVFSLLLKKEILSEWPFIFLLYIILDRLKYSKGGNYFSTGILTGLLISIRLSGMIFIPAMLIFILLNKDRAISKLKSILIFTLTSVLVFSILNFGVFHLSPKDLFSFYQQQWNSHPSVFFQNLGGLLANASASIYLPLQSGLWNLIVALLIITGFVRRFREHSAEQWFFLFYIFLILAYPYSSSGFRFLFPILPLVIIYFSEGISFYLSLIKKQNFTFYITASLAVISIFFACRMTLKLPAPDGPYSSDAQEAFSWIQNHLPPEAVVVFPRARALSLYGKRRSTFLIDGLTAAENKIALEKINCRYILYPDERSGAFNEKLQDYLMKTKSSYRTIWSNGKYVVLEREELGRLRIED